jgi:hypothetical protein
MAKNPGPTTGVMLILCNRKDYLHLSDVMSIKAADRLVHELSHGVRVNVCTLLVVPRVVKSSPTCDCLF